jgi:hypothetical protein
MESIVHPLFRAISQGNNPDQIPRYELKRNPRREEADIKVSNHLMIRIRSYEDSFGIYYLPNVSDPEYQQVAELNCVVDDTDTAHWWLDTLTLKVIPGDALNALKDEWKDAQLLWECWTSNLDMAALQDTDRWRFSSHLSYWLVEPIMRIFGEKGSPG